MVRRPRCAAGIRRRVAFAALLAGAASGAAETSARTRERILLAALARRDPMTRAHCLRTGRLAALLAPALDLDPSVARRAGELHDLGKIGMPDHILRGTQAGLSASDYAIAKLHPVHGRQLASESGLDPAVLPGIAHHHEKWNGQGYPDGLRGEAIEPVARLVAVADVLDAVTARRSYKPARPFAEGMAVLRELSGVKFDPRVVAYAETIAPALEAEVVRWQRQDRRTRPGWVKQD